MASRAVAALPAAVLAVLLGLGGGCREGSGARDAGAAGGAAAAPAGESKPVRVVYPAAPGSFVDMVADAREAVVHIRSAEKVSSGGPASLYPDSGDERSLGSGALIDSTGLVLTSDHVIAGADELKVVLLDGTELEAQLLGRDPRLDVALLEVDISARHPVLRLGESRSLQVGEWVLALGNPFGAEVTASAGIVAGLGRADREAVLGASAPTYQSFLHTDAVIDATNSGGPLLNTAGEVVGINSAMDKRRGGAGHAVPIDRVKDVLPMLREDGRVTRAWLGVFIHPVTREVARRAGLEDAAGALVSEVVPNSPAARAGIEAGDLIVRYGEREVDHRNLPWIAATSGLDRQIPVTVRRRGSERTVTVLTERMPE